MTESPPSGAARPARRPYVPAVGPKLGRLLAVVFGLFALLCVNAVYLVAVKAAGAATGETYENRFYLYMFLGHLVLGLLIIVPVVVFGFVHMAKARGRRNKRAVKVGYALFTAALLLLVTGVVLTRVEGVIVVKDGTARSIAYWAHVTLPVACAWLFILHRLAGKKIKWIVGIRWAAISAAFAGGMLLLHAQDPRQWNEVGNPDGMEYFFPSNARTLSGDFIPEHVLQNDAYCQECHPAVHDDWMASAHHLSSFNNEPYLASVRETRAFAMERDGNVNASRFCAGCHDLVPFFSGKFNDPNFDMVSDPTAHAGITCTACHAITALNSNRGNADYTIDTPIHYPFAFSDNAALKWINRQLVKAKPAFHKKTFLKPLHGTTEFCGTCHKVALPEELNGYKWLRGQNHQDPFLLSGVSGHGISSFYYPPKAQENCNGCHMPLIESDDFSARVRDESGITKSLGHLFPSANTAVPKIAASQGRIPDELADRAVEAHKRFNDGVMRVDVFGVRRGGDIDGELIAPLRPEIPALVPGETYLVEVVVRTVKMGHTFTQGTADSNQIWLDVEARSGDALVGANGEMDPGTGIVDRWAHFINAFVIDREGNRIARRNAEDIFTALYSNQIPPGAANTVHYRLEVPEDARGSIEVDVALKYRKFDTEYMRFVTGDPEWTNDLVVMELARDSVTFPIADGGSDALAVIDAEAPSFPLWQRWNDYGIGLLRKRGGAQLRQAEEAFKAVEALGRPDGPLNLARVYIAEGRVATDAPEALRRARDFDPPANEWSVLWFTAQLKEQNGLFDEAIDAYRQIVDGGFAQAAGRGFDFSKDWRVLNRLAGVTYERARQERGEARASERERLLRDAASWYERALELDSEDVTAHYGLSLVYGELGEDGRASEHAALHAKFKPDDNASDVAIAKARAKYPAANVAAEAVVIHDLD
ncbi:MAG: multiheme c-type cytochrome [Planctomycetota bacterium]